MRNERWRVAALGLGPLLILIAAMFALGSEEIDRSARQSRAFEP